MAVRREDPRHELVQAPRVVVGEAHAHRARLPVDLVPPLNRQARTTKDRVAYGPQPFGGWGPFVVLRDAFAPEDDVEKVISSVVGL
jgi:hypothetical protein